MPVRVIVWFWIPACTPEGETDVSEGAGFVTVTSELSAAKMLMRGTVTPAPKIGRLSVMGRPVDWKVLRIVLTLAVGSACVGRLITRSGSMGCGSED